MTEKTLVMGLGNRVMTDDAVGLFALEAFGEAYELGENADLFDGGTLGLELLAYMEGYDNVLIADCIVGRGGPGEVVRVDKEDVAIVFERCLSPHQMGLKDIIAILELQQRTPKRLTVVGINGGQIDVGTEPTSAVAAAIPEAVAMMASILESWGVELKPAAKGRPGTL